MIRLASCSVTFQSTLSEDSTLHNPRGSSWHRFDWISYRTESPSTTVFLFVFLQNDVALPSCYLLVEYQEHLLTLFLGNPLYKSSKNLRCTDFQSTSIDMNVVYHDVLGQLLGFLTDILPPQFTIILRIQILQICHLWLFLKKTLSALITKRSFWKNKLEIV